MTTKRKMDVAIMVAAALAASAFVASAACAQTGVEFAPIDALALSEKVGGFAVVALLLVKIIFNDLKHLNEQATQANRTLKLMLRLQLEAMGKNPDVVEAQEEVKATQEAA
jgi:hypothetical protein